MAKPGLPIEQTVAPLETRLEGGSGSVTFHDLAAGTENLLEELLAGLSRSQKAIPPKFFYDEAGCRLFQAICELPEYPIARVETTLMRTHSREMAQCLGPGCVLIEYGSGSSRKTRILLEALHPLVYVPIDIAREQLKASVLELARAYPWLPIEAICADYTQPFRLPAGTRPAGRRRIVYFPGSSIGNFTPEEAGAFLRSAREVAGPGGGMLVGVDLKKPVALLTAAYNDSQGVTAEFNLNLLARLNRELNANFDRKGFRHVAFYNERLGRIEMHLQAIFAQEVTMGGRRFRFFPGEAIHTENSYKYSVEEFQDLARSAGWEPRGAWLDGARSFAVHYLAASPGELEATG